MAENPVTEVSQIQKLIPRSIFGINGKVKFGLRLHPDNKNILFPLGNKIGISNIKTNTQEFISGHTNSVSCLDVSTSGRFIASGQVSHMGFRAYVILWDYLERKQIARHDLHKVRIQSVCFTSGEKYLISIGGKDDGTVIVYEIDTNTPICRAQASRSISGDALVAHPLHSKSEFFITSGDSHLRIWNVQREAKKLDAHDVNVGKQLRCYTGVVVDPKDECFYMGTMTGDIVKVAVNCDDLLNPTKARFGAVMLGAFGIHNPRKPYGKDCDRFVNGVRIVVIVDREHLLIGAGDGTVELVRERTNIPLLSFKDYPSPTWPMLLSLRKNKVNGAISSIVKVTSTEYYIATDKNEIYLLNIKTFAVKLLKTCHQKTVYQIVFPKDLNIVFATAGFENIRIWSTKRNQELLRIMVYNFYCASLAFTNDGTSIVSAWNDGVIRSFTPITGRLIYAIPNAHNKGCSALIISSNGRVLVTGGMEGQVRVWKIEPYRQSLIGVLKDHSGPISSLDFNIIETEVISASSDGCCVIWDLKRMSRKQVITANTQFMAAHYFPTGVQLLTCGSDGRISYWMVFNGSLIRELEGSKKSSVNTIAINKTGDYFVSVGTDELVNLWDYKKGCVVCRGTEHCSAIISAVFSPCGKFFVTGSSDGCVIIWDVPQEFWGKEPVKMPSPPPSPLISPKSSKEYLKTSESKKENIEAIVDATPKGDICCVECPPVNKQKMPDINETCNYVHDVKKC